MAYPFTPLPVVVEMYIDGDWTDITNYVLVRDGIKITRGFPDEGSTPEPSSISFTLNNRDGRFSPRNPTGPYYGLIGRNTPVRVRVTGGVAGDAYLKLGTASSQALTPAHASLDVTGDIDLRIDVVGEETSTSNGAGLAAKYVTTGNQRSWAWLLNADGTLTFYWSSAGTSGTVLSATSTTSAGLVDGERKALRVVLDVNNGSGGHTTTFYTADAISGTWVQLGSAVTVAGTTSIFASTAELTVAWAEEFAAVDGYLTRVYAFEYRNGIAGSLVANPDFTEQTADVTSFTDSPGRTWTLALGLGGPTSVDPRITDPGQRGIGEISEWPARWDVSGRDIWVPVTAQGVLRRLGQGSKPARSPLTSEILSQAHLVYALWPMEDALGSTSFASALSGASAMTYSGTAPDFASTGPILGSDKIPLLAASTILTGTVPSYDPPVVAQFAVGIVISTPVTPSWSNNTPLLRVNQSTSGSTVAAWELRYKAGAGGDLEVRALDALGAQLDTTGTMDFNIDNGDFQVWLVATQSGSDSLVTVYTRYVDDDGVVQEPSLSDTFTGLATTTVSSVQVAPAGGLTDLAVGQAVVARQRLGGTFSEAIAFNTGEAADVRARRLAIDGGVSFRLVGAQGDGEAMGPQETPSTFDDAFGETWVAERGLAFETREELGLTFRTRKSLYNLDTSLTLDYDGAGEIAPDLQPTGDDRQVRNDITVTRKGGSSARAVDETSRMGVQDPPDGVGRYDTSIEVNVEDDAVLPNIAGWELHVDTWDEERYPKVAVNMAALAKHGKTDLMANVAALDVGDRVALRNLPQFLTYDDVDLMALGFVETLGHPIGWTIELNCAPYGPWVVGVYTDTAETPSPAEPKRYNARGSFVDSSFDAGTDTALVVEAQDANSLWSQTKSGYDLRVAPPGVRTGGVRLRVTAPASAPTGLVQTLTVSGTVVNGVERTIPAGWQVSLWQRATYAR